MVKLKGAVLFPFQRHFYSCLRVVDQALFVVYLDDVAPDSLAELCGNFMCGTYRPVGGMQVGTCTNRWCDKPQTIVIADGAAGINFEHTGVDGHTVLRGTHALARSINPFHVQRSARRYCTLRTSPQRSFLTEYVDLRKHARVACWHPFRQNSA
ncbi:hypothetical protein BGY98DRAFT_385997 [Russula aff. rugulosa BPL654]|nr:hypothetical protein BGY98DRAFT_385997 [Russula aff. rugulosa BPL654]